MTRRGIPLLVVPFCHGGVCPPCRAVLSILTWPEGVYPSPGWSCYCHFDATRKGTPLLIAIFMFFQCGEEGITLLVFVYNNFGI